MTEGIGTANVAAQDEKAAQVEWADPPRKNGRPSPLAEVGELVRANPGKWAKLAGKAGSLKRAKEEGFEATTRGTDLYVRWPEPAE